MCALAGRTGEEHAVFRGHIEVAESLAALETGDRYAFAGGVILWTGMVCVGKRLRCALQSDENIVSSGAIRDDLKLVLDAKG